MYIDFLKVRKANLDKLTHTYQICSIRKRLNDVFDRTERRIKIYSSQTYAGLYLYTEAEDDVIHSKTKYLSENNPERKTLSLIGSHLDVVYANENEWERKPF